MARAILTKIWAAFFMFHLLTSVKTDCPTNIHKLENTLYFLSDDQVDSNAAEERCLAMGGNLAMIESENKLNNLIIYFDQAYTSGLQTVWVYEFINDYGYKRKEIEEYGNGELVVPTFKAYKSERRNYQTKMVFCNTTVKTYFGNMNSQYRKWRVQKDRCISINNHDWKWDFTLYVGEQDIGTKPLYRYENSALSVKLSLTDQPIPPFTKRLSPFYIPDINIHVGIRSDLNKTNWLQSNHVKVTYPSMTPKAEKDICQQMAFHYDDTNWIPVAMDCGTQKAYYVCQIHFAVKVESMKCNSTSLLVSWNAYLFQNITSSSDLLHITVIINDSSYTAYLSDAEITIENLMPRTAYTINATVSSTQCSFFELSTTAHARTGYGIPDPIFNASVQKSSELENESYYIGWKHDCSDRNITGFQLVVNSSSYSTIIKFNVSEVCKTYLLGTVYIGIPKHITKTKCTNNDVTFQIQPYNCEGQGRLTPVEGHCSYSPPVASVNDTDEPSDIKLPNIAIAGNVDLALPSLFVLILLIIGVLVCKRFFTKKRTQSGSKAARKTNEAITVELQSTDPSENPHTS